MTNFKNSMDFKKLSVDELLTIIVENTETKNTDYQRAFSQFQDRYAPYIYSVCSNSAASKSIYDREEIGKIAWNTLTSVSIGAKTYKGLASSESEDAKHKRVKGWLSTIARHEVYRYANTTNKAEFTCESIENYPDLANTLLYEEDEESLPDAEQLIFEKALSLLPEKFRDILETYLAYQDENGVIDPVIHDRLCRKWHVHPDYLRKVKKQAILKLKTIIDNLLNPIPYGVKIEKRRGNARIRKETEILPAIVRPPVPRNTGTG